MKIMSLTIAVAVAAAGTIIAWTASVLSARQRRQDTAAEKAKIAAAEGLVEQLADGLHATHNEGPADVEVTPEAIKIWKLPSDIEVTGHKA
ncbi:hypothetical protein ACFWDQ_36775 [Streptomyces sp. NPDC060053]|uniref:hypothetical protein n=1 Tax=Streptomyces sp. NPDC060053 TaxID=3347047 RepID=UPI003681C159